MIKLMGNAPNFYPKRQRYLYVPVSDSEGEAFDRLRSEMFPERSEQEVARKLMQDSLYACGMLDLPEKNRSRHAGRK